MKHKYKQGDPWMCIWAKEACVIIWAIWKWCHSTMATLVHLAKRPLRALDKAIDKTSLPSNNNIKAKSFSSWPSSLLISRIKLLNNLKRIILLWEGRSHLLSANLSSSVSGKQLSTVVTSMVVKKEQTDTENTEMITCIRRSQELSW